MIEGIVGSLWFSLIDVMSDPLMLEASRLRCSRTPADTRAPWLVVAHHGHSEWRRGTLRPDPVETRLALSGISQAAVLAKNFL